MGKLPTEQGVVDVADALYPCPLQLVACTVLTQLTGIGSVLVCAQACLSCLEKFLITHLPVVGFHEDVRPVVACHLAMP